VRKGKRSKQNDQFGLNVAGRAAEGSMDRTYKGVIAMGLVASIITACSGERPAGLGAIDGRLKECPSSPNCVSSQAVDKEHQIEPLTFIGDPDSAFSKLKKVLARRKDCSIIEEKAGYLRVELHTTLFVDDGEFLLDRTSGVIHVRSASRFGHWDMGKNRSRLEGIRKEFEDSGEKP
jgi:uncharacterized protein (DUF1499 family)